MKYSKIVLAGGNGYLGKVLSNYFKTEAGEVVVLSRRKLSYADENIRSVVWNAQFKGEWISELEGADLLVNLCGKNVNCRYTVANRREIIDSRVLPTKLLGEVISDMAHPPKLWI